MISTTRLYLIGALLCAALGATSVQADPMVELAVGSGCFICHSIDASADGDTPLAPSYRAIAARYKNRSDAFTYLTQRVLRGTVYGEQNWSGGIGMRFMPPNLNVSSEQAASLVNWILALDTTETADTPTLKHERMLATATTSGCLACHHVYPNREPRMVPLAPAFADIGKRFGGRQADAVTELTNSVLRGTQASNKKWHEANMQFMPPNVALEPAKAKELVEWILTLKP